MEERGMRMYQKPLVVHKDGTIFLIQDLDKDGQLAQKLTDFADMIKIPEGVSTFEMSPYALWSAAAKGYEVDEIITFLRKHSCNELDKCLESRIKRNMMQYMSLKMFWAGEFLALQSIRSEIIEKILTDKKVKELVLKRPNDRMLLFSRSVKIELKKQLFKLEFYAIDATNVMGKELDIRFLKKTRSGSEFCLREYQLHAATEFLNNKEKAGGGGVIIMPPGSGKTSVGLKIIESLKTNTMIIAENESSAESWKRELLDKTDLAEESILLYKSNHQGLKPITITTYPTAAGIQEIEDLAQHKWGLIIYDDAHRLPATKYIKTVDLSSKYKLALAATLYRSDNKGTLIYALIGPKWYNILPQTLRTQRYLGNIKCREIKVPLSEKAKENYMYSVNSNKNKDLRKIAAENDKKQDVLTHLIKPQKRTAIASHYKGMAKQIGHDYQMNHITSEVNQNTRMELVEKFNLGKISSLIITKVGEQFKLQGLDVLISVSYNGKSSREEYLRLGKLMEVNKKNNEGWFFSVTSRGTVEEDDYKKRRRSLINYGYRFKIFELKDLEIGGVDIWS